ncbi:MAG TPA: nicotinate-nucleotide adenylyltransferase [Candidatus Limnocylindrales bacterium]|nr:nicotinate-nucleotide adenylyltransferase [Candidatus Limnocylindrales bacterium]
MTRDLTAGPPTEGAWGLLGGTFDPIHYAHLAIAEWVRETLGLAGVLFVPAARPPHKLGRPISPATDRAAMVVAAIADNPAFRLSRLELERPGVSYTVDTVEAVLAAPPQPWQADRGLIIIISAEAAAGLPTWHEPLRLLRLSRLAIVPRHGYVMPDAAWLGRHVPGLEERVLRLDGPDLGHSASLIRQLVGEGRSIRYLVPPAVEAYVREHALYRAVTAPAPATVGGRR